MLRAPTTRRRALVAAVLAMGLSEAAPASDADVLAGRALFRRLWVPAPTRTDAADGLGPLFNARSCTGCHKEAGPSRVRRDDARAIETIEGVVFRVAGPDGVPHSWYGRQLQTGSVPGLEAEARARLDVAPSGGVSAAVTLLGPQLGEEFRLGARLAPPLHGVALLDRVDEAAVLDRARPEVQGRLGLAGQARVLSTSDGGRRLGRFGWKASQPDLVSQTAEAFASDLGLSSPLRPAAYGDCTPAQSACLAMPNGESAGFDGREISQRMLDMVVAYLGSLTPPGRTVDGPGAELFAETGCAACHVPEMPAKDGSTAAVFTDLLLHDMGTELDDGVAEPAIISRLWRTAPLIDVGTANGARRYLHDGRAGSIAEAVRWHGGEAASARQRFERLSDEDRSRLVAYLEGR